MIFNILRHQHIVYRHHLHTVGLAEILGLKEIKLKIKLYDFICNSGSMFCKNDFFSILYCRINELIIFTYENSLKQNMKSCKELLFCDILLSGSFVAPVGAEKSVANSAIAVTCPPLA